MKYTVEKKQSYVHVRFSCNATEWEAFMEKAYQQNKGKYAVQGFRKGHAPRKVLEKSYGKVLGASGWIGKNDDYFRYPAGMGYGGIP